MSARSFRRAHEREVEREQKREQRLSGRKKAAVAAGAGLGATVMFAPAAEAATFTVSNLDDSGAGSLREAIADANAAADADTVVFQSGLSGTITLTTGEIDVEAAVDIQGPGANVIRVSGNDASRIFYVDADSVGEAYDSVSISGLTLVDGNDGSGGALYSANTTLTLKDMVFSSNEGSSGGALWVDDGNVFITDTVFDSNESTSWGGAFYLSDTQETAPTTDVEASLTRVTFVNNSADSPGGAFNIDDPNGHVLIEDSTFSGNTSTSHGGGINVHNIDYDGGLTIRGTTITGNSSEEDGGGAYLQNIEGDILVENSTIANNTAFYNGGGIAISYLYDGQSATVRNSTVVENVAGLDPMNSGDYSGGGLYLDPDNATDGTVDVSSTIVFGNTADNGPDLGQDSGDAGVFDVGFSLIGTFAGADFTETPAGSNITGVDPQLGPLQDNGGPTQTREPALTSPAVDAGVANGLATDQRGLARTADISSVANRAGSDGTDIGSVEIQAAACQGANVPSKTGTEAGEEITGTDGPDALFGLGGDDTIAALRANDCADGGAGNDSLNGDQENDLLLGGADSDRVFGGSGKDTVKGDAGKDTVKGGGGADKVDGGAGNDLVNGQGGKDKVKGGAGKDKIKGGPKKDKLKGNAGKDKINAIDGTRDKVNCGGGKDVAKVDEIDRVSRNCETVKVKS